MINVAAIRMQQFGVQFYQASLTARDIDKFVRFEVLSYSGKSEPPMRGSRRRASRARVNWELLERRIASSEHAYQRHIIRRKIDELIQYYEQCRQAHDLPSIPGAVIISCDEKLSFIPLGPDDSRLGTLQVPEREGILRAIDGQHRLLALHADIDRFGEEAFAVPAVIFDRLPEDHVVQMFVTINAKHTRLNPSHLVGLSGRQLYRDESLAAAHDIVRALDEREDSPLYHEIKLLGVGRGKVAQAPLAQEFKKLFGADAFGGPRKSADFRDEARRFFINYFKQVAQLFGAAWTGRKIQHQDGDGPARLHPRGPGRRSPSRPGARRAHRLPGHRSRDCSLGPADRRPSVRDRRGVEARGHVGRCARQGTPPGAAVPGRRCRLGGRTGPRSRTLALTSMFLAIRVVSAWRDVVGCL